MLYSVPGTDLRLDDNMHFFHEDSGKLCDIRMEYKNGSYYVPLSIFGRFDYYNFDWVLAVSKFDIFREDCLWETRFETIPYTILNERKFIYFERPVYYDSTISENSRYRIIPGFCRYAIDQYGNCIRIEDDCIVKPYRRKGYLAFSLNARRRNGLLRKYDIDVHRLVAMTWLRNPDPSTRKVVNHIDADKTNNYFKNLEWTTVKGNARHAVSHNLLANQRMCKLRNVNTGEIYTFPSMMRALEFLGREDTSRMAACIKNKQANFTFCDKDGNRYEYRDIYDTRPWFYENATCIVSKDSEHTKSQQVYRVTTDEGKVYLVNGLNALKEFLDICVKGHAYTANEILRRAKLKFPNYIFETIDTRTHSGKVIEIQNDETKEVMEFKTIHAAMKHLGLGGNGGIRKALAGNGSRVYNGYRFRYRPEIATSWPIDNTTSKISDAKRINIIDKRSGSVIYADSLREASRITKLSGDAIRRIIRNPKREDRYKMSYIEDSHTSK